MGDETTSTYLSHAAIDNEVLAIHEAAFITGEEQDSVGLFDSLAKPSSWEVDLAAMAFCCIIAQPVLQESSASKSVSHTIGGYSGPIWQGMHIRLTSKAQDTEH